MESHRFTTVWSEMSSYEAEALGDFFFAVSIPTAC